MKKFLRLSAPVFSILMSFGFVTSNSPTEIARQLVFPVTGSKSNIGSVWGDERDAGARKHEGIDIFAAKGTAVVALSDGVIEVVRTDEIGGNNITLQPDDYSWNAYYAHLDQMYVRVGDRVQKGQLIGTVGNTGNAKTTPPHLHFGIYTAAGAIDPLPYVKTSPKISAPIPVSATARKSSGGPVPGKQTKAPQKKQTAGTPVENAIKNAAVQIVTGELLRRVKIRL